MIYLDHAATSWPKPPEVTRAMVDFLERAGGNPGRSGHRLSIAAARVIWEARQELAALLGCGDPARVVWTANATHALNLALRGLVRPGDRVVTTGMEHNAVMRPLRALEARGAAVTVVRCAADGALDLRALRSALEPGARLVVVNHASNVTGTLQPLTDAVAPARAAGARLLVDAAQTAGVVPIDVDGTGIDLLAFTGHKGLLGPPGTGGLVIGRSMRCDELEPLVRGGTGSRSEFEAQPTDLPDKYESGTANGAGIAGLAAGVRWLQARGLAAVREHDMAAAGALVDGLRTVPGVTVHGPTDARRRTATVSFTASGRRVSEIGLRLDEEFGVLTRVGLHCAPAAHRTIGTFPAGTVRLAAGPTTTMAEVEAAVRAVAAVLRS